MASSSSASSGSTPAFDPGSASAADPPDAAEGLREDGSDSADLRLLEPQEVRRLIWEQVPLVDARSAQEYLRRHLPGALHLPHGARPQQLRTVLPDPSQPLILFSNGQTRAAALARRLVGLDYGNVYVLGGGIGLLLALQDA